METPTISSRDGKVYEMDIAKILRDGISALRLGRLSTNKLDHLSLI
jgi:hypothetical protein